MTAVFFKVGYTLISNELKMLLHIEK